MIKLIKVGAGPCRLRLLVKAPLQRTDRSRLQRERLEATGFADAATLQVIGM